MKKTAPPGMRVVEVTYNLKSGPYKRVVFLAPEDYEALRGVLAGRNDDRKAFGDRSYTSDKALGTFSTRHTTLTNLRAVLMVRLVGSTGDA